MKTFQKKRISSCIRTMGFVTLSVAAVTMATVPNAPAQAITWGTTKGIAGDSDVSTNGVGICAYAMYPGGPLTVNTVTFTEFDQSYAGGFVVNSAIPAQIINTGVIFTTTTQGYFEYNGVGGGPNAPFDTLSANYQSLLSSIVADDPGGAEETWDLTFTNLVPGHEYEVELWENNSSGTTPGITEILSDPTGLNPTGSLTSAVGSSPAVGQLGTYIIGTANADTNGTITVIISAGPTTLDQETMDLDAFQLRIIGAGFPPTAVNPVISPTNSVYAGTPVTIDVTTGGPVGIPSYAQWQWDQGLAGAFFNVGASTTNIPMPVNTTSFAEGTYNYRVVITNLYGSVTSSVVTLTIQPPNAPIITVLSSLYFGTYLGTPPKTFQLEAAVTGSVPLTNQWQTDLGLGGAFSNIGPATTNSGPTTSIFSVNTASLAAGTFNYQLVASNSVGSSTSSVVTVTVGAIPSAPAQGIAWGPMAGITGDSDVSTNGVGICAYAMYPGGPLTINSVTFTEFDLSYTGGFVVNSAVPAQITNTGVIFTTTTQGYFEYNAVGGGANAPFNTLSANYQKLLSSIVADDPGGAEETWDLTFTNLVPGVEYEVELFDNNSDGSPPNITEILTDPTGLNPTGSLTSDVGSSPAVGQLGTYIIGTANADTNGTITVIISAGPTTLDQETMDLDAFQLRQLGPVLNISSANGNVHISWTGSGSLQEAPTVVGPWTGVTGATSPYTTNSTATAAFFRLKL